MTARLDVDQPSGRPTGSLFTGVLGLDIAAAQVFGTELAWACDNDPAAAKVIESRAPGVPNLGDITRVGLTYTDDEWSAMKDRAAADPDYEMPEPDWSAVPAVDLLIGGSPCQDVSAAGKRAGMYPGTRSGLWEHMTYAIARLRPRYVVFENVRGLTSACAENEMGQCPGCVGDGPHRPFLRALGRVLGDLADLRYDAVWCGLPASAVGACHERYRVFVLAVDTAADAQGDGRDEGRPEPAGQQWRPDAALSGGEAPADSHGGGRRGRSHEPGRHAGGASRCWAGSAGCCRLRRRTTAGTPRRCCHPRRPRGCGCHRASRTWRTRSRCCRRRRRGTGRARTSGGMRAACRERYRLGRLHRRHPTLGASHRTPCSCSPSGRTPRRPEAEPGPA